MRVVETGGVRARIKYVCQQRAGLMGRTTGELLQPFELPEERLGSSFNCDLRAGTYAGISIEPICYTQRGHRGRVALRSHRSICRTRWTQTMALPPCSGPARPAFPGPFSNRRGSTSSCNCAISPAGGWIKVTCVAKATPTPRSCSTVRLRTVQSNESRPPSQYTARLDSETAPPVVKAMLDPYNPAG